MRIAIIAMALCLAGFTGKASANQIIFIEQVGPFTCVATYSDGSRDLVFCPLDVPPVSCQCEHLNSPFDDICETMPQGNIFTYRYESVGYATVSQPGGPTSPIGYFSCPRSVPPNSYNCTARAYVTNILSGETRSGLCYSN